MAGKTKSKKSRKGGKRAAGGLMDRLRGIFASVRTPLAVAAWLIAAGAVVAGAVYGVPRLEREVVAGAPMDPVAVEFTGCPAWVTPAIRANLEDAVRSGLSGDPLAQMDLVAAHDALLATGWFLEVQQVRRTTGHAIVVDARFATPFAVVRDGEGDHLVSADGRLLPQSWTRGGAPEHLPLVDGVYFDRPQRPGRIWDGGDVQATLRVLRLIDDRPWRHQVVAADAGGYLTEGLLRLVTTRGSRIIWGAAPGDEAALEVSAAEKLRRLDTALEQCGHIDCGFAGEVDFTGPVGVVAR